MLPKITLALGGPAFSALVQGYWRLDQWAMTARQRLAFLQQHMALGITTVDHAAIYGEPACEALFGEALRLQPGLRQQLQVVSKCGIELRKPGQARPLVNHYDTRKERIIASVDASLSRLGVTELDVLLIHRPDFLLHADEVAAAFAALKAAGKVRYFGVSNFNPAQFDLLQSRLDFPLVTNQVEINPLNLQVLEDGTLDQLQQRRIHPMAWSCLAGGRIFATDTAMGQRLHQVLNELKEELRAQSVAAVVYAWVLRLPVRPLPILGSGNIQRVREAVDAMQLNLSPEQWYRVWVAAKGHDVP